MLFIHNLSEKSIIFAKKYINSSNPYIPLICLRLERTLFQFSFHCLHFLASCFSLILFHLKFIIKITCKLSLVFNQFILNLHMIAKKDWALYTAIYLLHLHLTPHPAQTLWVISIFFNSPISISVLLALNIYQVLSQQQHPITLVLLPSHSHGVWKCSLWFNRILYFSFLALFSLFSPSILI